MIPVRESCEVAIIYPDMVIGWFYHTSYLFKDSHEIPIVNDISGKNIIIHEPELRPFWDDSPY